MKNALTVNLIGLGYIGLPTAAIMAQAGIKVVGTDISAHVCETINRREIHIQEPGLQELVESAVASGLLSAQTEPAEADVFVIAVPTPFITDLNATIPHRADMSYVNSATASIAKVLKAGDLVLLESTSPVRATEDMVKLLSELRPDLTFPTNGCSDDADVFVAYCPERILPGRALEELVSNDRLCGGLNPSSAAKAKAFYELFVRGECVACDARSAELAKLAENSFRDVNIAFANELSMIADYHGVDPWNLISMVNRHPRVNVLQPSCGVGGHCIAIDPWFIVAGASEQSPLIRQARLVNDSKPRWVAQKIIERAAELSHAQGKDVEQLKVAVYGMAFKPDIDDMRESPAIEVVNLLAEYAPNVELQVYEPFWHKDELPETVTNPYAKRGRSELTPLPEADLHVFLVGHSVLKKVADHSNPNHLVFAWGPQAR